MTISMDLQIFIMVIPFTFERELYPAGCAIAVPTRGPRYVLDHQHVADLLESAGLGRRM